MATVEQPNLHSTHQFLYHHCNDFYMRVFTARGHSSGISESVLVDRPGNPPGDAMQGSSTLRQMRWCRSRRSFDDWRSTCRLRRHGCTYHASFSKLWSTQKTEERHQANEHKNGHAIATRKVSWCGAFFHCCGIASSLSLLMDPE